MVQTITHQNIDKVLNDVIKKLDEAYALLNNPGCSTEEVGKLRCQALNAVRKSYEEVREIAHQTYLL